MLTTKSPTQEEAQVLAKIIASRPDLSTEGQRERNKLNEEATEDACRRLHSSPTACIDLTNNGVRGACAECLQRAFNS